MNGSSRISDIKRLYELLDELATRTLPPRLLSEFSAGGVYFFYEDGERRSDSGTGYRVVRVGSTGNFRNRLGDHECRNKVSSVFRLLVGTALLAKNNRQCNDWEPKVPPSTGIPIDESQVEQCVTETLGQMRVLCLPIEDGPNQSSLLKCIEENSIALLSNYNKIAIDPPSDDWLGLCCTQHPKVPGSGLWNRRHVIDDHKPEFLDTLEKLIRSFVKEQHQICFRFGPFRLTLSLRRMISSMARRHDT